MWSSSLSQAILAAIYVLELGVAFEIVHHLRYIHAWSIAISEVTVKSWVLSLQLREENDLGHMEVLWQPHRIPPLSDNGPK